MEQLGNRHVLIVGASGMGKTTAEIKELVEEAERGDTAIVCIDPHTGVQGLAAGFFAHLCTSKHRDRVLYDRLRDVDRVLKWDFLAPSRAASPHQRHGENETRCEQFAEILLRRRGQKSAEKTPDIEEWLLAALKLFIYQRKRRPLADIRYAFSFAHPTFQAMLDGCQDAETRYQFEEIINTGMTPYKAAGKLIKGVFRSVSFQVRTEHTGGFNFERHLDNKGIVIVEGGKGGPLSPNAMRAIMGAIVLKTLNYLRERAREFPHVTLALDEANNANLIGEAGHEVEALAELRKYGLGMHILIQYLDFIVPRIERGVLTNCDTRKYFRCPETRTATRLGDDLGGSYESKGTKARYYKDGSKWDAPATFENPYANELRSLPVGVCYVRRGNRNSRERITPLPDPYPDYSKHTREVLIKEQLAAIKQRPEYYSPDDRKDEQRPADDSPPRDDKLDDGDSPFGI